ncbi:MAG: hypothetical protein ACRDY6_04795 [Acidimicrobiia bacterium]
MCRLIRAVVGSLVVVLVLAFAAGPLPARGEDPTRINFRVPLTSQQQILEKVGSGGDTTYGWNELTGTAATTSGDVQVQMLGNVEYVEGSGPFFGFITLRFGSLSTLGLRMNGTATVQDDGSTALAAKLRVIGGNAGMTGARGKGRISGERREDLGGAIEITITLRLRGIDT